MNKQLLIIGYTFPEPSTTAAGKRMLQLISVFLEANYAISFASTASHSQKSIALDSLGVKEVAIELNCASFDSFLLELHPSIVVFDRYITEEQFGWRVAEQCPEAVRILDTEDLHFLRKAREEAFKKQIALNIYSETAKRELASILRCDLSLIISEFEMKLLVKTFNISETLLCYVPFLMNPISEGYKKELPSFEERQGFVTIGNLLHAPNVDSVVYLKQKVWPYIRKALPKATVSIYGNYAPQHIKELHSPANGFLIDGWTPSAEKVMQEARVCLAPLRFGAGLKGKLVDAMVAGTPSVTTSIGAEGMHGTLAFSGIISDDPREMATRAIQLYTEKQTWKHLQKNGFTIIAQRFQKERFSMLLIDKIAMLQNNLLKHRKTNFIGQILQHQTNQATKYMSKWIEAKNT